MKGDPVPILCRFFVRKRFFPEKRNAIPLRVLPVGLPVPFEAPYTVSVTNSYGVATNYNVHRTTNILSGAITIIVS